MSNKPNIAPVKPQVVSHWQIIIRLIGLTKPQWPWLVLGTLLSLLTLLANIALLAVSGWFISAMTAAGLAAVTMNYFTPAGVIRFLAITRTAGRYAERLVTHNATFLILAHLRHWFYLKIEPLAPAALQQRSSDLLTRLQMDIEQLDNFYLRILLPCIVALLAVPIIYATAHYFHPPLALLITAGLAVVGLVIPFWVTRKTTASGLKIAVQQQRLTTAIIDGLQGARELEIYAATAQQSLLVDDCSAQLADSQSKINKVNAIAQSLSLWITQLTLWLALLLLASALSNQQILDSHFVMLLLLTLAAFETVLPLPLAFEQLPITISAAQRIFSLADLQPIRQEPKTAIAIEHLAATNTLYIKIKNLNFYYPNNPQHLVLKQLTLQIKQGSKIAISGASGSGKSTLIKLLQGFYPSPKGAITIGGYDINLCKGEDLRQQLSLVSQHSYLFAATIRDNLLLANPAATEQQLQVALAVSAADQFISRLPLGLDTWLGETGRGLSGGQARRLHIAQALLKDAPILILDEPTEGLDPITEQQVIKAIWQLMENKTVILITHNARLLQCAESIYYMNE